MGRELDEILDKCIDRMNAGESLEDCLTSYPDHAHQLEPLLSAMMDARQAFSSVPRSAARAAARRQLAVAVAAGKEPRQKRSWGMATLFGRRRVWATVSIAIVLALVAFAARLALVPGDATPVLAQANFQLLLSDEVNAIGDFDSLEVTVTGFGVLRGGEGGGWEEINLDPAITVDLTDLSGLNAQQIWNGTLPEGQYRKVFIYIEDAIGFIDGEAVEVIVPSGNLHISKPFAISEGDPAVNFVYDITVVAAGNEQSGVKYILLPQIGESGADQEFHEVGEGKLILQVVEGEVVPGGTIAVLVTSQGDPVADASVQVNDEHIGTTDADGLISLVVPYEEKLEIEAELETSKGKLKIRLGDALALQIVDGVVGPGESITLQVTLNGRPVPEAVVEVNDEHIGTTDAAGLLAFIVPFDDELEVEVTKGELEGELEYRFKDELVLHVVEGEVVPGASITVLVTLEGNPAPGATVTLKKGTGGVTDGNGQVTLNVPFASKMEIEAELGDFKGRLKIRLDGEHKEGELVVEIVEGEVAPGEVVTVQVTFKGNPVPGALVTVNDEYVGTTGDNGLLSGVTVPYDDEMEIEAVQGDLEGELEIELDREHREGDLDLEIVDGEVAPGETVTILVTFEGNPVPGASVEVNGDEIGTTADDGLVSFIVPDDGELEVEAELGGLEGKLKIDLEEDDHEDHAGDDAEDHDGDDDDEEEDDDGDNEQE